MTVLGYGKFAQKILLVFLTEKEKEEKVFKTLVEVFENKEIIIKPVPVINLTMRNEHDMNHHRKQFQQ